MNATIVRKTKGPKEPSMEQLAKGRAKANGNGKHLDPAVAGELEHNGRLDKWRATNFSQEENYDARLRDQLRAMLAHPNESLGKFAKDDRAWAQDLVDGEDPLSGSEKGRAVSLLAKHGGKLNGHVKAECVPGNGTAKSRTEAETKGAKRETKAAAGETGEVRRLPLKLLDRHPANRKPGKAEIEARAASIEEHGQFDPITVRPRPGGRFQVLSGETRWLAVAHNGGSDIDARIRECDDAEALILLAEGNAQRQDLNPIEKAQLIERLCQPVEQGGAGLTREAAGQRFGLKDGASASNLVRLLKLPKVWQERVAAGELPESFARMMVPYCHAPKLMDQVNAEWLKDHGPKANVRDLETWDTRSELERTLHQLFAEHTRPVDDGDTFCYGYKHRSRFGKDHSYECEREYPLLFELTPELEKGLEILEFEPTCLWEHERKKGKNQQPVRRATNWALWDKHQVPAVKKHVAAKAKGAAQKSGRDKPAPKKELTPAQQKQRAKEQAEQLQKRIDRWRHYWLASLVAREVPKNQRLREWVLLAMALDDLGEAFLLREAIEKAAVDAAIQRGADPRARMAWESLAAVKHDSHALEDVGTAAVCAALTGDSQAAKWSAIDQERMDELAAFAGIDLAAEWKALQDAQEDLRLNGENDQADASRFACFFELFQSGQLDALGEELGVHVGAANGKATKVKLLTTRDRHLKLPSCIKPLAAAGKRKASKSKAVKGGK